MSNSEENKNTVKAESIPRMYENTHRHIDYGGDDAEHTDRRSIPLTPEQIQKDKWRRIKERFR